MEKRDVRDRDFENIALKQQPTKYNANVNVE